MLADVTPFDNARDQVPQAAKHLSAKREAKPNGSTIWALPDPDYVRERVSLDFWHKRAIAPLDPVLGELFTTTSRIMLAGPTGIGKTNFLMAGGIAMADGADFLHWRGSGRPRRVLYIDGEMSRRLLKSRIEDAVRRHGSRPQAFFAFNREDFEDMPPLDSEAGQKFVDQVIEALGGGIEMIFLDNLQALTIGDLREPESWRNVLPWVRQLTRRRIGQVWGHHTGINEEHAYGDKSREWQLDTVILLEAVERPGTDIAFAMQFPKARERTPQNRADFGPKIISLADDRWIVEDIDQPQPKGRRPASPPRPKSPSPTAEKCYAALLDALAASGERRPQSAGLPSATRTQWESELVRLGLVREGDDKAARHSRRSIISRCRRELIAADWIACNGDFAWSIRDRSQ